jgi:oxalate decarboxylase/phosphoglucose isomerase-like protein (cupin superfamily)
VRAGPGALVTVPPGVMHDFRNPGDRPARWLGIAAPGGLEQYFQEVHDLAVAGHLTRHGCVSSVSATTPRNRTPFLGDIGRYRHSTWVGLACWSPLSE